MPRIPLGMGRLIAQVSEIAPKAEVAFEDVDGFGVYRRLRFDKKTTDHIKDALGLVAKMDNRIQSFDGSAIQFVHTIVADENYPFSLPEVQAILKPKKATGPKRERQAATKKASAKK